MYDRTNQPIKSMGKLNPWGVDDKLIFKFSHEVLKNRRDTRPFYLTIATLSNHYPYSLPDKRFQFLPDKKILLDYGSHASDIYYRPFAHIIPMLCYLTFHTNVVGFHFINLILFWFCCLIIYQLIHTITGDRKCALLTSVLFCVHPINGLFVNYITASVFGIQVLAMALASILFLKNIDTAHPSRWRSILVGISLIIACLSHETAFALPIYLFLMAYLLRQKSFKDSLNKTLSYFIIVGIFFLFRIKFASLSSNISDKVALLDLNAFEYIATVTRLLTWYLSQLF